MKLGIRLSGSVTCIAFAGLALGGCTSSPTYGTGKTAMEQLVDDLGQSVSLTGDDAQKRELKYSPRPGLVVPSRQQASLATPQKSVSDRQNNPQWAESPEEVRKRLVEEADANKDNPNYRSPLLAGTGTNGQLTEAQKWEAFRKAKAEAAGNNAINPNGQRRYLTDPPLAYSTLPQDSLTDLGEPEDKKAKRRKKEAEASSSGGSSWWNPFQ